LGDVWGDSESFRILILILLSYIFLSEKNLGGEFVGFEFYGLCKTSHVVIQPGSWHENWKIALNITLLHAWTSGRTALLPEKVLGLEPISPRWSQFAIRPRLHCLDWASAVVPSAAGAIRVKATREGMGMKIDVVIPEKPRAVVSIPVPSRQASKVSANGQTIWENGKSRNLPTGVRFQRHIHGSYQNIFFHLLFLQKVWSERKSSSSWLLCH
jgi:hypothetical protein